MLALQGGKRPFYASCISRNRCKGRVWAASPRDFDDVVPWSSRLIEDMNRDIDRSMQLLDRQFQDVQRRAEESLEQDKGWVTYRRQEKSTGPTFSRYFSEQVVVYGNTPATIVHPPSHAYTGLSSLSLLVAALIAGAWTAVTMAFNKGYKKTIYSEDVVKKVPLLLFWPILLVFSAKFREQFNAAIHQSGSGKQRQM